MARKVTDMQAIHYLLCVVCRNDAFNNALLQVGINTLRQELIQGAEGLLDKEHMEPKVLHGVHCN